MACASCSHDLALVEHIKEAYLTITAIALPSLCAAFDRITGCCVTPRLTKPGEFFLVRIFHASGGDSVELSYRCCRDPSYVFTLTMRDNKVIRVQTDRERSASNPRQAEHCSQEVNPADPLQPMLATFSMNRAIAKLLGERR